MTICWECGSWVCMGLHVSRSFSPLGGEERKAIHKGGPMDGVDCYEALHKIFTVC